MRYRPKLDRNQDEIAIAYRDIGATVVSLAGQGSGCPDLLVGFRGVNYLVEVKDDRRPPSEQQLNPRQKMWHLGWQGQVAVVRNPDEALAVVGVKSTISPTEVRTQ